MADETSPITSRNAARDLVLVQQFTQAIIRDPAFMEEIPKGAALVLFPDDQSEMAGANRWRALASVRRGGHVYIRHVHRQRANADPSDGVTYSTYPISDVESDS